MSKEKLREAAVVLICIAAVATFLGLVFITTNNFMPTTVIGRVVAYRQTIDPILKYKYTVVVMVYDTIIFKDESEPRSAQGNVNTAILVGTISSLGQFTKSSVKENGIGQFQV